MTVSVRSAELFDRLLSHNPFTDNRVNEPSDDDVDLAELNRVAFEQLTGLAHEALAQRRGIGAMLWGEAGVGKSHLLSRLDRWARTEGNAVSIYLHNLLASPTNLPRVLVRNVISKLTWTERSTFSGTLLFQLISNAIGRALGDLNGFRSWSLLRQTLFNVLVGAPPAGPADAGLADPTVVDVLFRFYRSVLRRRQGKEDGSTAALAVQWLRGDTIPADQAHALLGLPPARDPDGPVQIEDAQQIKQVLVALSRLIAACDQPFILAFDQVDNLEDQQASALARFLEAVIDSARNLFAVTAGIQPSLVGWHDNKVIQDSAWDRMAQIKLQVTELTPGQARQLLEVRVRRFFEAFEDVPEAHQMMFDDTLFPVGVRWFEKRMEGLTHIRPREILNAAREAWQREQKWLRQQGGPTWLAGWRERQAGADGLRDPIDLTPAELNDLLDQVIDKQMMTHVSNLRGVPPDRDSLAEGVAQLLEEIRRLDPASALLRVMRSEQAGTPCASAYHLFLDHRAVDGSEVRTGVVLAHDAGAKSTYHILSKLVEDIEPPARLLLLVSEDGVQVGDKGQDLLDALLARPNCHVEVMKVPAVELVTLDALHAGWNLARSEDLDVILPGDRTRIVTPDEVIASHQRKGRFNHSSVLLAALASPMPAAVPAPAAVAAPVVAPEPELAMATLAMPFAPIDIAVSAPPVAAPVVETVAPPVFEDVLFSEPEEDIPAVASKVPVAAMPVDLEAEADAILFGEEEPMVAEPVVAEDATAVMMTDEPAIEASAEADAAAILFADADEEGAGVLTGETVATTPMAEDDAEAILLSAAEEEPAAIELNEEEAGTILLEAAVEEDAEAILLEDATEEGAIVLGDEDAEAILLEEEEEPKLEL
jgi:hypothetical protein